MTLNLSVRGKEDHLTKIVDHAKIYQVIIELMSREQFKVINMLDIRILDDISKIFLFGFIEY
jgi:dihydroneopterin aldolase